MTFEFHIGDRLHSSCADDFYGEVTRVGVDDNGAPIVDLLLFPHGLESLIDFEEDKTNFPDFQHLTSLDISEGTPISLRDVQYKYVDDKDYDRDIYGYQSTTYRVLVHTPGHGCYRCTKLFSVFRKP